MLAAHVIAAVLTVLVLRRGEALVLTIAERVVAAVCPPPAAHGPLPTPARVRVPVPPVLRPATSLVLLSSPGRRGRRSPSRPEDAGSVRVSRPDRARRPFGTVRPRLPSGTAADP